ncbi:MAG: PAS domain S-box protein [Immundisolibacteraceae bacterium]|nr:PAS domain S-box protein [Immundisolibacteraceae bacterium]
MTMPPSPSDHSVNYEMYRYAFEKSPAPTIITRLDNGLIIDVNPAFERWTGSSRESLVGRYTSADLAWLKPVQREKFIDSVMSHHGFYSEERLLDIPGQGPASVDHPLSYSPLRIRPPLFPCLGTLPKSVNNNRQSNKTKLISRF